MEALDGALPRHMTASISLHRCHLTSTCSGVLLGVVDCSCRCKQFDVGCRLRQVQCKFSRTVHYVQSSTCQGRSSSLAGCRRQEGSKQTTRDGEEGNEGWESTMQPQLCSFCKGQTQQGEKALSTAARNLKHDIFFLVDVGTTPH